MWTNGSTRTTRQHLSSSTATSSSTFAGTASGHSERETSCFCMAKSRRVGPPNSATHSSSVELSQSQARANPLMRNAWHLILEPPQGSGHHGQVAPTTACPASLRSTRENSCARAAAWRRSAHKKQEGNAPLFSQHPLLCRVANNQGFRRYLFMRRSGVGHGCEQISSQTVRKTTTFRTGNRI